MFVDAISAASLYTKPIHTISRLYKGTSVIPGAATFFYVNERGGAITCRHVAEMIIASNTINDTFQSYSKEFNAIPKNNQTKNLIRNLEMKYKYTSETTIQLKYILGNAPINSTMNIHLHPTLDLAAITFTDHATPNYATFVTNQNKIKQGKYLCRLGFPFPEFTNFIYNATTNDIDWTNTGNVNTPIFPIDGIITRFTRMPNSETPPAIGGIEMSTPGLRGQSGGPLFDTDGLVYGVQSATSHLYLGFDINQEVVSNGKKTRVTNQPFLNVGQCIHVNKIKEFLTQLNIPFYQE